MNWLNYHHLYYFWVTAREGSLTKACKKLRLAPSTVSAQLRLLEDNIGTPLFQREGRRLVLTERGRIARSYCDEIFGLGREMLAILKEPEPSGHAVHVRVGVADILHKWLAHRILMATSREVETPIHWTCRSDHHERLLTELSMHSLDLVLTDTPIGLVGDLKLESVRLGTSGVVLVGSSALVETYRRGFPDSLAGAPMLLPSLGTPLRRQLEEWFDAHDVLPMAVGEFADSALMKAFGRDGAGLFPIPALVAEEVCEVYGVELLGPLEAVEERFFLVKRTRDAHPLLPAFVAGCQRAFTES